MKNNFGFFTAGEMAKIHEINKRTLHYYDQVGIFSPKVKGENGYRYYSFEQSMELEHILAFRELGMSIEEIKSYMQNPNSEGFCMVAEYKIEEINQTMERLKHLKNTLVQKKQSILRCRNISHGQMELVTLPEQYLLLTEIPVEFETNQHLIGNTSDLFLHLKKVWSLSHYRQGCGSYISVEKIQCEDFQSYDGIYSQIDGKRKGLYVKPKGQYLRGYCIGDWDYIPEIYKAMTVFAKKYQLSMSGFAFESGLNEFAISGEEEYVTQIEVLCEP